MATLKNNQQIGSDVRMNLQLAKEYRFDSKSFSSIDKYLRNRELAKELKKFTFKSKSESLNHLFHLCVCVRLPTDSEKKLKVKFLLMSVFRAKSDPCQDFEFDSDFKVSLKVEKTAQYVSFFVFL